MTAQVYFSSFADFDARCVQTLTHIYDETLSPLRRGKRKDGHWARGGGEMKEWDAKKSL